MAHGYLALALVAPTAMDLGAVPPDAAAGLNYGLDKVRFIAPVKAGARVRNCGARLEPQSPARLLVKLHCTLEIEASRSPRWWPRCWSCWSPGHERAPNQAAQHTLAANPLVGVRGADLAAARALIGHMARNPACRRSQYLPSSPTWHKIATGRSELAPAAQDKRFADSAWKESLPYRALAQAWLAWGRALNGFIDEVGMDKRDAERARFVVSLVDALAPTNSLGGNPAALKRLVDTGGASLARGLEHFVSDLAANGGLPAQVDRRGFEVGKNLPPRPARSCTAAR